jgi:hypothetical protein
MPVLRAGKGCPSCASSQGTVLRRGEVLSSGGVIMHNQGHPNRFAVRAEFGGVSGIA